MRFRRIAQVVAITAWGVLAASCTCVQEMSLKPTVSVDDLRTAQQQVGGKASAALDVTLKFRDCCPSSEQRQLLVGVQRNLAKLYDELVGGRITLQDYNAKAEAARIAVEQVARVCGTRSAADDAWTALAGIDEDLRQALSTARAR